MKSWIEKLRAKLHLVDVKLISTFALIVSIVMMLIGAKAAGGLALYIMGIGGLVLALLTGIFVFLFWRCPACGAHLPWRRQYDWKTMQDMQHCPYCGAALHLNA